MSAPNPDRGPPTAPVELLRPFWTEAQVPADRRSYLEFQARRYRSIVEFLRPYGDWAGRRALDLGGGVGGLGVVLAHELGARFDLAEYFPAVGPHAEALARRGVEHAFRCDLSQPNPLAGLPGGYDAILLVEVLEHLLVNPLLLFREIWDHLAPNGLFFLTTPNQARVSNRYRLLLGRTIKERGRYPRDASGVFGHVIEFSRGELDHLLRSESFRPDRSRIVQQVPTLHPSAAQRLGVRLLNTGPARRLELGDDILAAYRKVPRPSDGQCPVPVDPSGRI